MRKIFMSAVLLCVAIHSTSAQNLLTPAGSEMIFTIRSGEIFQKMSLEEIENMPYLKGYFGDLFRALGPEIGSFSELGIDMNKTSQLFIDIQDDDETVMMGMSLPLSDVNQFKTVFDFESFPVKSIDGVEMITRDGVSAIIKGSTALLTYSMQNENHDSMNYYDDVYEIEATEEVPEIYYEDEIVEEMPEEVYEEELEMIEAPVEIEDVEEIVEEQVEIEEPFDYDAYYEELAKEREAAYLKEMEEKALVTEQFAMKLISDASMTVAKADFSAYEVDEQADFSILIKDYNTIMSMYQKWTYNPYSYYSNPFSSLDDFSSLYGGVEYITSNGYFKEDGMEIEIKQKFSDELAELNRKLMGELNPDMLKYIPYDSEIGHLAFALNTEQTINAYYDMTELMVENLVPDKKEAVEVGIAFAKLFIDEAAIGNLFKGDVYFGVTDLNSYEIEYTSYEYDENWNYNEVTKTKQEIRPDFLLMFSSEEYDLMSKVLNMISVETGGEFKNMGDYYSMSASKDVPLDIYCMHKDGLFFVFTSQALFDSINKGGTKAKSSQTDVYTKNYMSMTFDAQKLFSKIPLEDMSEMEKEMILSSRENLGEFSFTYEKMEGNTLTGTMSMETNGDYSNSLEYFINLFNEFGRIENDFKYNRN